MNHRLCCLVFSLGMIAPSCADDVSLSDRPCPCASGWICCAGRNTCIPDTQFCQPADQGKKCPCEDNQTCCQLTQHCIPFGQSCGVPLQPEITHHPSRGARVPCAEKETDSQLDGSMIQTSWTFIHDIWGNVTEMLGDRGNDNTTDYDSRWEYNIYGNL